MARSVRILCHADIGASTTGVAGPGASEGHPAGTVFIAAVAGRGTQPMRTAGRALRLAGHRAEVRAASVDEMLELVLDVVGPIRT
jgi:nicotinamide-nucleotide amidase